MEGVFSIKARNLQRGIANKEKIIALAEMSPEKAISKGSIYPHGRSVISRHEIEETTVEPSWALGVC